MSTSTTTSLYTLGLGQPDLESVVLQVPMINCQLLFHLNQAGLSNELFSHDEFVKKHNWCLLNHTAIMWLIYKNFYMI